MTVDVYVLNLTFFDHLAALLILPYKVKERAISLKFKKVRIEYIASQWLRYKLLGVRLGISVDNLNFSVTKTGRPYLINSDIDFNISHTENYVVMAITKGQKVGVDVQSKKHKVNVLAIAKQYFDKSEYQLIEAQQDIFKKQDIFYWLWAYKEASLKLTGEGIAYGLNRYIFELDENSLCLQSKSNKISYFHEKIDENTIMCVAIEKDKQKTTLHFL